MIESLILPGTNLKISRLSFGTASLHHLYTRQSRQSLLEAAFDVGVTHFDTSPYYGYGMAEQELGAFLNRRNRNALSIATKVGLYPPSTQTQGMSGILLRKAFGKAFPALSSPFFNWTISVAEQSLHSSLRRLKTEYVDILFLHEPDPSLINSDEFLSWLEKQQQQGKIRYWGLAGLPEPMKKWVEKNHPLGAILQVKDSLDYQEANTLLEAGRAFQFTYGYLSASNAPGRDSKSDVLLSALQRNRTGAVLFSTRRRERLAALSSVFSLSQ